MKNYNTKLFSGRAEDYTHSRPSYPEVLADYLFDTLSGSSSVAIADVGSGTGKFAECLIKGAARLLGGDVTIYGVEPNDDMRRTAERELSEHACFRSVAGSAEQTTLPDSSVDIVTAAQAFHWFNAEAFASECRRILRDGGRVCLVWNERDLNTAIVRELYELYGKYCPRFKGFSNGLTTNDQKISEFFNGRYDFESFDNPLRFDKQKFVLRSLSSSYSLSRGDARFDEYIAELNALFDKHAHDSCLVIPCRASVYIGSVN